MFVYILRILVSVNKNDIFENMMWLLFLQVQLSRFLKYIVYFYSVQKAIVL